MIFTTPLQPPCNGKRQITPRPCASTSTVPKVQAKQRFNAQPVLSFNDALAGAPGISSSANIVRLSLCPNKAVKPSPANCSMSRRRSRLPRMPISAGQWSDRGFEAPITWHALFSMQCH